MRSGLRGKPAGLMGFLAVAGLVAGGLGWATAAALRLEREQLEQRAEAEQAGLLRLALWRLDSRLAPLLAREDGRPFSHYSAVYPVPLTLDNRGACRPAGTVLEPSPLLTAELPPWMLLHFQTARAGVWESPQVLSPKLERQLHALREKLPLPNVTPQRRRLLADLTRQVPVAHLLREADEHTQPATVRDTTLLLAHNAFDNAANPPAQPNAYPMNAADLPVQQLAQTVNPNYGGNTMQPQEYETRRGQQARLFNERKAPQRVPKEVAVNSAPGNTENWIAPGFVPHPGTEVLVNLSPMVPVWLDTSAGDEQLVFLRLVHIEDTEVCQGIVLDGPALQETLAQEVVDLFPEAKLLPMREEVPSQPERTMTALPLQLDPGPAPPVADPGWTPLRVGLALAWLAALVALSAVGLGGWSLLNLSERRIRFVSAVTHELRTPLTTLRLYLDMLTGGLVRDPAQRDEYLHTLHAEADRLHRLVANVLDFSRLENQRPRLNLSRVPVTELLEQVRSTWAGRCHDAEKELIVENDLPAGAVLAIDRELVQQVLGNLIDNACKYSRGAEDRRLWLRARPDGRRLLFEIEDRGPGVPAEDRRLIFRAFRRGRGADETAGGVGLGLALASRWVRLLGGRLSLQTIAGGCGACFRVALPLSPEVL